MKMKIFMLNYIYQAHKSLYTMHVVMRKVKTPPPFFITVVAKLMMLFIKVIAENQRHAWDWNLKPLIW